MTKLVVQKILVGLLALLGLAIPAQASFTGLILTSGGNIYECTSTGTLTLAAGNLGISAGAIACTSTSGSNSDFYLLNAAGTDLYLVVIFSDQTHTITHVGSLGVTGIGLTDISGTLYTLVNNSQSGAVDLYTVSTSTGAASLSHSTITTGSPSGLATDGTYLLVGYTGSSHGVTIAFTTGGSSHATGVYKYSDGTLVPEDLIAWGSSKLWIYDNSSFDLSESVFPNGLSHTVIVDATLNSTYNGMCWGYVPF